MVLLLSQCSVRSIIIPQTGRMYYKPPSPLATGVFAFVRNRTPRGSEEQEPEGGATQWRLLHPLPRADRDQTLVGVLCRTGGEEPGGSVAGADSGRGGPA
jgi:hypothetical protein